MKRIRFNEEQIAGILKQGEARMKMTEIVPARRDRRRHLLSKNF